MGGNFVRFICAFCGEGIEDDPRYAHLRVDWPYSGESQAMGAHGAYLRGGRAAVNPVRRRVEASVVGRRAHHPHRNGGLIVDRSAPDWGYPVVR